MITRRSLFAVALVPVVPAEAIKPHRFAMGDVPNLGEWLEAASPAASPASKEFAERVYQEWMRLGDWIDDHCGVPRQPQSSS